MCEKRFGSCGLMKTVIIPNVRRQQQRILRILNPAKAFPPTFMNFKKVLILNRLQLEAI